jgi:glucose/arabinose dehydrogenase
MRLLLLISIFLILEAVTVVNAGTCSFGNSGNLMSLNYASVPPNFCSFIFANNLERPRGIRTAPNGDIVVVESGVNQVTALWLNETGAVNRAVLANETGLNHGVAIHNNFLFASNPTTVFRWKYPNGARSFLGASEVVVRNLPCCHHITRTILFDDQNRLYVQSGSGSNVDPDPSHGQIRRFANMTKLPLDWLDGELFASGLRNEVGLRFDPHGRLFGVENGRDELFRADLGGDIHQDNPAEEVNIFAIPGRFYGYPYCWTQFDLPNVTTPRGTQWADKQFFPNVSDEWCRTIRNVVPPAWSLQAHMAPLDIIFSEKNSSFPSSFQGAFIAFHGSWNRNVSVGYRVDMLTLDKQVGLPVSQLTMLSYNGSVPTNTSVGATQQDLWPHRPVGLTWAKCHANADNCLLVTSDESGVILALVYEGNLQQNTTSTTAAPQGTTAAAPATAAGQM